MTNQSDTWVDPKGDSWTSLIDEVCAGNWINPDTGTALEAAFKSVEIGEQLDSNIAELVRGVMPAESYAVVSDGNTYDVLGKSVADALSGLAGVKVDSVVLQHPHADVHEVASLREKTRQSQALVAVGSGTINDLCKYTTANDGRQYCIFGTAPSMNGYTSTTASITLDNGMKTTQAAHAANGVFLDLNISAAAPQYLVAAGLGDSLCRSTAQIDWYLSHRLLDTRYFTAAYVLQEADEVALLQRSAKLGQRDVDAIGYLYRIMILTGLGISTSGMSHPGSMGEHQISHWIDSFAGDQHPGTIHGQQVGVSSITMAKLQRQILASESAPQIKPTVVDEDGIRARYPAAAVEGCLTAARNKAFNAEQAAAFNEKITELWPNLRTELLAMSVPAETLEQHLSEAGGGVTAEEVGIDRQLYRNAVRYALEIRDRYSMLDLAADMGILDDFVEAHC